MLKTATEKFLASNETQIVHTMRFVKVQRNGMPLHSKSLEIKLIFLSVSTSRARSKLTWMIWGGKRVKWWQGCKTRFINTSLCHFWESGSWRKIDAQLISTVMSTFSRWLNQMSNIWSSKSKQQTKNLLTRFVRNYS